MSSPPSEESPDSYRAVEVDELQRRFPTWFIMWLPYTRRIGAWHMADPGRCRYAESANAGKLSALMCEAELEFCRVSALPTSAPGQAEVRQAPSRGYEKPRPSPLGGVRGGWSGSRGRGYHARVPAQRVGDVS
ncbi:hypothetical protein GCM10018953_59380 [Streptosporangium nondiastaticum]